MGDLNTELEDGLLKPMQESFAYARTEAPGSDLNVGTFNGFGHASSIIDHVFYDGDLVPLHYWVHKNGYGLPMLSDHYPVLVKLDYK
ncbi:MAG: hypothetical protein J6X99_04685 [Bacteroidales bacterium]|nr:hypothetical protein [Bacteroidales bacterium]